MGLDFDYVPVPSLIASNRSALQLAFHDDRRSPLQILHAIFGKLVPGHDTHITDAFTPVTVIVLEAPV